jgi:hypothetical protein
MFMVLATAVLSTQGIPSLLANTRLADCRPYLMLMSGGKEVALPPTTQRQRDAAPRNRQPGRPCLMRASA